jgi:hypothetical protein
VLGWFFRFSYYPILRVTLGGAKVIDLPLVHRELYCILDFGLTCTTICPLQEAERHLRKLLNMCERYVACFPMVSNQ